MPSRDSSPVFSGGSQQVPPTRWYPTLPAAGLQSRLVRGSGAFWLSLEGSLTRALQMRCRQQFHVDVLSESFTMPSVEEALTLGLPLRQRAWIREVQLCGDGEPWVMARTVIPRQTLTGKGRRLRHLGRKPLGAWLFSRPEWRRGAFQTGICQRTTKHDQPRIARRSRFYSGKRHLLVGEYFLPALLGRSGNRE
ncbi:chorismate--pyruvate lyase family protein [Marinobacter sp.]|uniref:chorismate--pyruvate lyase family protein n=1 Tax=Marinobacter sp. TaxID=50741 RepID=UPI003850F02F